MATIHITDNASLEADLQIEDDSQLAQSKLQKLIAPVKAFIDEFSNPIDQAQCTSITLGAGFNTPKMDVGNNRTLTIKQGINAEIDVSKESDKWLFGQDEYAPSIPIGKGQAWVGFELDATFDTALSQQQVTAGVPSGFGVCLEASTATTFTSYTLFQQTGSAPLPSGKECFATALSNFKIIASAQDIRNQKLGTVHVSDLSGDIKFTGSYSVPMAVNSLALASVSTSLLKLGSTKLPFNYTLTVEPNFDLEVSGSVKLSGEYSIRFHKISEGETQIGVYKKRQTTLTASFDASAGIGASTGKGDITGGFFKAISPKVDPKAVGLKEEDCKVIEKALNETIDHSLSVSLNLACSAAFADEAAFFYSIDLTQNQADTDAALEAALRGDWTPLQNLPNAKQQRNVLGETKDTKHVTTVNLLGIYNYESLEDFVQTCTVLHDQEDGTVTVTDKETANRIAVAATPYFAADQRLRAVLNEACVATLAYTAAMAGGKLKFDIKVSQTFLIYKDQLDAKTIHKDLLTAVALQLMNQNEWQNLMPSSPNPRHVRIAGQAIFDGDAALHLFFSDVQARTPRTEPDLKLLGRRVLISLLDPTNPVDLQRIQNLNDDTVWAKMDSNQWTPDLQRLSYPDWYDVTFWAGAMADVAPALKPVLEAVDNLPPGQDPSANADFMSKRAKLAAAIGAATRNSHAAYEAGWPLAILTKLSDFTAKTSFEASWDGETHVNKQNAPLAQAAASTASQIH